MRRERWREEADRGEEDRHDAHRGQLHARADADAQQHRQRRGLAALESCPLVSEKRRWDEAGEDGEPTGGFGRLITFREGTGDIPLVTQFNGRRFSRTEWTIDPGTAAPWTRDNFLGQDPTLVSAWGSYWNPDDTVDDAASGSKITLKVTNNNNGNIYTYVSYAPAGDAPDNQANIWRWVNQTVGIEASCEGCSEEEEPSPLGRPWTDALDEKWGSSVRPNPSGDDLIVTGDLDPSFTVTYEPVVQTSTCCVNFGEPNAQCLQNQTYQQCENLTGDAAQYWNYQCANCVDTKKCCIDSETWNATCLNGGQEVSETEEDSLVQQIDHRRRQMP